MALGAECTLPEPLDHIAKVCPVPPKEQTSLTSRDNCLVPILVCDPKRGMLHMYVATEATAVSGAMIDTGCSSVVMTKARAASLKISWSPARITLLQQRI